MDHDEYIEHLVDRKRDQRLHKASRGICPHCDKEMYVYDSSYTYCPECLSVGYDMISGEVVVQLVP